MQTIHDIVYAFGGPAAFGRFFEVPKATVNTWRRRNSFPAELDVKLIEEAGRRKINLTYKDLAKIRASKHDNSLRG